MSVLLEYKGLVGVAEQAVSDRTVTGFAAVFGNVDQGNDVIMPGAFTKTISERGKTIKHLWQHDTSAAPIAKVLSLKEVARNELPGEVQREYPDATGGLIVVREYLTTPRAEEVLAGIKGGAIDGMSFGYDVPKGKSETQTREGKSIRVLREVRLWETSDVVFPMNPATRAAKMQSKDLWEYLDSFSEALDLLRTGQALSTDDMTALERIIAAFRATREENYRRQEQSYLEEQLAQVSAEGGDKAVALTEVALMEMKLKIMEMESWT